MGGSDWHSLSLIASRTPYCSTHHMSNEAILMSLIALALGIFFLVRLIRRTPVQPDPWDSEVDFEDLEQPVSQLCTNCLAPVDNPRQHYCPACGNVTGEFTRYIPFLNIPFNYSLLATLWGKLKRPETSLISKIVAVAIILVTAPLMLVVGLPILCYCKLTKKSNKANALDPPSSGQ